MNLNFDKLMEALIPWDASMTFGRTRYPIRPLSLGDVARLESLTAKTPVAEARAFLLTLFPDISPPLPTTGTGVALVAGGVVSLFQEHCRKNPDSIVAARTAAMETSNR